MVISQDELDLLSTEGLIALGTYKFNNLLTVFSKENILRFFSFAWNLLLGFVKFYVIFTIMTGIYQRVGMDNLIIMCIAGAMAYTMSRKRVM